MLSAGADDVAAGLGADARSQLMATVRDVVARRVAPRAEEIDRNGEFPDDIRALFAELGLLGLTVPERFGGAGASLDVLIQVVMEIAATCANSANIITQQALAMGPLLIGGTDEQKSRWLPAMADGQALGCFALTEPGAGSDNRSMVARAQRRGDHYVINGTKVFCTWGSIASIGTVFAQSEDDPDGAGIVALVVELPADGFNIVRTESKLGLNGSPTVQIALEGLVVPVGNRLGAPGDGLRLALDALDSGRVEIGALALGIASGALRFASLYLDNRRQFGELLSSFQGLQFRLADHLTAVTASRLMLTHAAKSVDGGRTDRTGLSAMAKLMATDVAASVTGDAICLLGGYGYMKDYPVERMFRDAKVLQIVEGTNEIQRIVIAREWLRELRSSA